MPYWLTVETSVIELVSQEGRKTWLSCDKLCEQTVTLAANFVLNY